MVTQEAEEEITYVPVHNRQRHRRNVVMSSPITDRTQAFHINNDIGEDHTAEFISTQLQDITAAQPDDPNYDWRTLMDDSIVEDQERLEEIDQRSLDPLRKRTLCRHPM